MQNLEKISDLINIYFHMQPGELIENYLENIELFQHQSKRVFIKRRVLKHFVESRKKELVVKHTELEALGLLNLAISKVQEVFENFDSADIGDKERKIFSKDYSHIGLPYLRVVHEEINDHIELVSIHFRKLSRVKNPN